MDSVYQGEMLRHIRTLAGVSRERAAQECSITPQMVSHWENGRVEPSLKHLRRLAPLYRMSLDELLAHLGESTAFVAGQLKDWYAQVQAEAASDERSGKSVQPFGEKLRRHDVSRPTTPDVSPESTNFKTPAAAALRGHGSKVSAPLRT